MSTKIKNVTHSEKKGKLKMKKKILSIVAILLMFAMLVSLTACGDEEKEDDDDKDSASTPKEAVEEFLGYIEKGKFSKASDLVDWTLSYKTYDDGYYLDYEEIEDMSSREKREYEDDNEADIESAENYFESYETSIDELDSFKIKVDIDDAEKVEGTKKIYKVEAEVEMKGKEDRRDDENTKEDTITFYVMKDDGECKIINGVYDVRYMISDFLYF